MKAVPALGAKNYSSEANLLKRKIFAGYFKPKINLAREIFKLLKLKANEKVLDVGCGNGDLLIELRHKYHHTGPLYGLDIANGILKKAILAGRASGSKINFSVGDARNIKFSKNHFDAVIIKHVLHNIPDYEKALAECHRVLKKGGRLALAVTGQKTRIILKRLKPKMARLLGLDFYPYGEGRASLESITQDINKNLWRYQVHKYKGVAGLKKVKPYLDYVDSGRDFWGQIDNKKWRIALDFSKRYLEAILKQKGVIKDQVIMGIIVAIKK